MAKKTAREKIRLVSSEGTGHFYTTTKNKRNMPEKMEIKKFDPVARKPIQETRAGGFFYSLYLPPYASFRSTPRFTSWQTNNPARCVIGIAPS